MPALASAGSSECLHSTAQPWAAQAKTAPGSYSRPTFWKKARLGAGPWKLGLWPWGPFLLHRAWADPGAGCPNQGRHRWKGGI